MQRLKLNAAAQKGMEAEKYMLEALSEALERGNSMLKIRYRKILIKILLLIKSAKHRVPHVLGQQMLARSKT